MRMADTPNNLFEKEMALVKMWVDNEVEYIDLPPDVQDALTEVFSEEPTKVAEPVVEEQFVKQEAVQHLDLLHKANDEHRFTLGPWYIPNRYDAHGEWTDANELQSALWDYVKGGDRDIRLQHNKDIVAGEWLEAMSFPVPVTIGMKKSTSDQQVVYPAGTVFLGVQWKPWAWDMVKAGKIRGFSIGGAAARIEMQMPEEINKASFGGDRSEAGRYAANVRWRTKAHSIAQGTANLKAGLNRQQPKGDKPNIAQRIKDYFQTLPVPYRQEEDKLLREKRRANENFVDDTKVEAVSLPSGRTAIMQGGKLTTTKFPSGGMTASAGRPLRSPKPKTKPTGRRQKQWLESGYGGAPKVKQRVGAVGKSDDSLRFQAIVDAKVSAALKKNSPTSSAVHVDAIMGSKGKKKKRVKPSLEDVKLIEKTKSAAWQRAEGKNPEGGLNAKGRASYKRETGGTLKPPVKRGDNPRRASFLARMGNAKGPERDEKGEPTRLLLSLQAWGANSKIEARKKAKAISARNKNKEMEKASFGGDRSEAGRYAANIRWQRATAGIGSAPKPTTKGGKILRDNAPSLVTHCDLDGLAKEMKKRGIDSLDHLEAPELVMSFLTPEKRTEIKNAIKQAVEGIPVNPNGPIVYIKGGGGASGKSSADGSMINIPETKGNKKGLPPTAVISNADDYKTETKAFQAIKARNIEQANAEIKKLGLDPTSDEAKDVIQKYFKKNNAAAFVHEESSMVGKMISSTALKQGKDLVIDGTMDNGLAKRNIELDSYRQFGAKQINGIFYSCDTEEAVRRSQVRAKNENSDSYGRLVPEQPLRNAHAGVSKNFPNYLTEGKFDSIVLFDTNLKDNNRLVLQYRKGEDVTVIEPDLYDDFLEKASK